MKKEIRTTTTNNAPVYGLGLIGAMFYYIGVSSGFLGILLGIAKAILWPAFLVYEAFLALGT
ncbi:MAG: hypothetical protein HQ500_06890 [Flavobacteriales bacterium]|nr:hypothetical protein [Flavobacteriales bacterium]